MRSAVPAVVRLTGQACGDKDRTAGNTDSGFQCGGGGLRHTPGDIIEISDNAYAGTVSAGGSCPSTTPAGP